MTVREREKKRERGMLTVAMLTDLKGTGCLLQSHSYPSNQGVALSSLKPGILLQASFSFILITLLKPTLYKNLQAALATMNAKNIN